jgi:hypothetical protein
MMLEDPSEVYTSDPFADLEIETSTFALDVGASALGASLLWGPRAHPCTEMNAK